MLTKGEENWLIVLWEHGNSGISKIYHRPKVSTRILNSLVKKGYAENIHDTFYKITDKGLERCRSIY